MLQFSALFQLNWTFIFLLFFISPLFPGLYHKLLGKPFYVNTSRIERGKYDCSIDILQKKKKEKNYEYSSLLKKKMGNISVLTVYQKYLNINRPQALLSKSENELGFERSSPVTQNTKGSLKHYMLNSKSLQELVHSYSKFRMGTL